MKQSRFLILALFLCASASANAGIIAWTSLLVGANEVPSVPTTGVGAASGTINDVTGDLTWNVFAGGLSSDPVAAHFHLGAPGTNGDVVVNLGMRSTVFPKGGVWMGNANVLDNLKEFLAGNFYINIHTQKVPSGEIRGQVTTVPEPGSFALIGIGFLALGLRRFIRR